VPLSPDPEARQRQLANLRPAPPAPPGNQRGRRHGAYGAVARDRVNTKVAEYWDAMAADAPLRGPGGELPAADEARVQLAAECRVRLDDVGRWLDDFGARDQRTGKERRSLLDLERRLRVELAGHLDALGMSTAARARLGWDVVRAARVAVDPALALSEPDPQLRREMMEAAGLLPRGEDEET
jgi:hypothetical protein